MEIIDNILRIMDERKISKYNVAKHCDFQNNLWAYWQSGRQKPGLTTLIKIADYFNVSLDYLVGRETHADTNPNTFTTQENIAHNATTAPLLNFWQQLDEIQQSKVLVYMQGMLGITDQSIPTPMDIAINEGRTLGHKRGREEVEKQKQKKTI